MNNNFKNKKKIFSEILMLIKYPLKTKKAMILQKKNQYTFILDRKVTKIEIKYVMEYLLSRKVLKVRTAILHPRKKRCGKVFGIRSCYKKAYITVKNFYSISTNLYLIKTKI